MTPLVIAWLRLVFVISMVFLGVYGADQSGLAPNAIIDSVVPSGTVEENDAIVAGETVSIDGDVDGDLLVLAVDATINGNVSGSVVTTAESVTVNGEVDGSVYTVGRELVLAEGSSVGRSVYFLGLRLETEKDSKIARDLSGISLRARLSGSVGRDLKAIIGLFELLGQLTGGDDAGAPAPGGDSELPEPTEGGLWGSLGSMARGLTMRSIGGAAYQPFWPLVIDRSEDSQIGAAFQDWMIQRWARQTFQEFVLLLVTGLFMLWRYPKRAADWVDKIKSKPFPSLGYGFLGIVIAVNIFILANIVAVLVAAGGFWLGFSGLWKLAFVLWSLGFTSLGLFGSLFYMFVFYGSKVIVVYMFSRWVVGYFSEESLRYRYLIVSGGVLVYALLQSLPFVGWLISLLMIMAGMGSIWLVYRDGRPAADAVSEPVADVQLVDAQLAEEQIGESLSNEVQSAETTDESEVEPLTNDE